MPEKERDRRAYLITGQLTHGEQYYDLLNLMIWSRIRPRALRSSGR